MRGTRVVELGCVLGVVSLVAAAKGANVTATDWSADAIELLHRNAERNGLALRAETRDWRETWEDRFDLAVAADVLYERSSVALLIDLLPRAGREVLLADPGRPAAAEFLERAAATGWTVSTRTRDRVQVHHLRRGGQSP